MIESLFDGGTLLAGHGCLPLVYPRENCIAPAIALIIVGCTVSKGRLHLRASHPSKCFVRRCRRFQSQVQSTESPAASSMRRRALRPADPSSVRGELERKAEVRMAAAEREGQLKRQRDVAIEQVPCLGTSLGLEQLPRSYIRPHRCVLGTGRGRVQARLPQGCRRWPARSKYPCSPSHESMRPIAAPEPRRLLRRPWARERRGHASVTPARCRRLRDCIAAPWYTPDKGYRPLTLTLTAHPSRIT